MPFEVWALVLDGRRIKPSILRPSYFLVDGDDWLAHIQRSQDFKNATVADTIALDEITRKLHGELNVMGIQPIVFLEKAQSKYPRNSKTPNRSDSNRALLQQFRKSLKCLSVDIEECDCMKREGAMLAFLRTVGSRAAEYSCYIYGSALLDLWAVRGISYILFDSLSISEIGDKVQAPVWNKAIVAAALFVTESQLAELMILVGNRHTKPYGRKGYRSRSGGGVPNSFLDIENDEVKGIKSHSTGRKTDDMVSLAAMRDWLLAQGANFTLRFPERFSPNVKGPFTTVDQAIEFSRAYYDNRDLSPFYDAIELAENSSSKSETPRPPTNPTVAAAMIMSAISGSTTVSSSRTVTITSGKKAAYDPYTADIKVAETNDKLKQRKKEKEKEKEYPKQSAELETQREVEVDGKRTRKDKTDRKDKKDLSTSGHASNAATAASTATATATGGIDAGKGVQLKNLLGIKFGSPQGTKSAATPALKVDLKDGGGDSVPQPLVIDTQMVVESSPEISVSRQGSAGGKTSKSARTAAGKSTRSDGSAPPTPTVRLAPGPGFLDSRPAPVVIETLPLENAEMPIDAHRSKILAHVDAHPVTIIQGVPGCGKSSRLPKMLLEHGEGKGVPTMIMVCQPCRIAATALRTWLQLTMEEKVGLRLEDGVKEETADTKLSIVSEGYLVRLLTSSLTSMAGYTHLVIDEVQQRTTDGDIICLLARKVLEAYPAIKIVLMGATMDTKLYEGYFSISEQSMRVDGSSVPPTILHCDELSSLLPVALHAELRSVIDSTSTCSAVRGQPVADQVARDQLTLAAALIKQIASEKSSILVFVSGMADICDLVETFESMKTAPLKLRVIIIHSDMPHEEQLLALQPLVTDEARVIIATHAAESSLTLPDCDHVICLGTDDAVPVTADGRRIVGNSESVIKRCWISKASAAQRAGCTGRVRPGTVYRLYSETLHAKMPEHGQCEVCRSPLSEVMLRLAVMLEDGKSKVEEVTGQKNPDSPLHLAALSEAADTADTNSSATGTEIKTGTGNYAPHSSELSPVFPLGRAASLLLAMLEPPDRSYVNRSFQHLFDLGMINTPDANALLTETGKVAGRLPVDLTLGRFVSYGVAVALSREAVIMAAALSLPKSPFRFPKSNSHSDPDEFIKTAREGLFARSRLDCGHLSEPIMLLHALLEWRACESDKEKSDWCHANCIVLARMRLFNSAVHTLQRRLGDHSPVLRAVTVCNRTANMLRLVSTWCFGRNLLCLMPPSSGTASHRVKMSQSNISAEMVSSIFKSPEREANGVSDRNNGDTSADQSLCVPLSSSENQPASSGTSIKYSGKQYLSSASSLHWSSSPHTGSNEPSVESDSVERGEHCPMHYPDMQWRLEADVKRVHAADYVDRPYDVLLSSFTCCVKEAQVSVAWMHLKHSEKVVIVMTDGILDLLRGAYFDSLDVSESLDGLTTASVTVADTDGTGTGQGTGSSCDQQLARLDELFSGKMSTMSWTLSAASARRSSSSNIYGVGGSNIFSTSSSNNIYNAPSKDVLLGSAVLECADCVLSDLQIRQLFLGSESSSASSSSSSSSPSLESWAPVCSVVRSKAVIEFLPDTTSAHSAAHYSHGRVGEESGSGSGSKGRFDIIKDDPLGLRLLNTIRMGGKDPTCVELVGRGEGFTGTLREGKAVSVAVASSNSKWVMHDETQAECSEGSTGRARKVSMPTCSLQQVAQHAGLDSVFAVSCALTTLGDGDGDGDVRAEGVTLLPVGLKWITLAMQCANAGTGLTGLKLGAQAVLSEDELSQAAVLHDLLVGSRGPSASDDVWRTTDTLFAPWLSERESERDRDRDTEGSDTDLGLNLDSANITETTATPPSEADPVSASVSAPVIDANPVTATAPVLPLDESPSPLNIVLSGASWLFRGSSK